RRIENGHEEVVRERGVEGDSAFDVGLKPNVALDDDKSARLVTRQSRDREHNFVVKLIPIDTRKTGEQRRLAELRKGASNFMLEDNDDCEHEVRQDVRQHP